MQISVRRSRRTEGGLVYALEMGRGADEERLSAELGVKRSHPPGSVGDCPFDHRVGGIAVHVHCPDCSALPRRQKFIFSPRKPSRKFRPCNGPNNRSLCFRDLLCFTDFFSESLQTRFWTSRDEYTHPCSSSRELYCVTSKTRKSVNGLGTFGCHCSSEFGLTTAILVACCLLTLELYAALVFWSPQSITTYSSEKNYRSHASPKKPIPLPHIDDPATVDLSVIVPTYNETKRIPSMLDAAIKHIMSVSKRKTEILIVDDGSTDGTVDLALEYAKENPKVEIRVIERKKNSGKGGVVRHGMLHSRGKRLLMVDADGASRFEDLELLWAALDRLGENNPDHAAIAIGSRAHLVKSEAVVKVLLLPSSGKFDG